MTIQREVYAGLKTSFIEATYDTGDTVERILMPLEHATHLGGPGDAAGPLVSGRLLHPVTGEKVDPATVLHIDGAATIARYAGKWTPIPYLRFVGRDELQRAKYDAGPQNWARIFVNQPNPDDNGAVRVTFAFDTSLSRQSRLDSDAYLAPNLDDAAFGSTFICASAVEDVAPLLGERWLETWLEASGDRLADAGESATAAATDPVFAHRNFAHYLTLLRLLASSGVAPEVRFTDTIQHRFPLRSATVDLIVDIGDVETTALLVDVTQDGNGDIPLGTGYAEPLRLRDLTEPGRLHEGAFPTSVEFAGVPFGDPSLSRDSGRIDAFVWPSLVRIGHEARRLALRNNGTEGVTGLSNLRSFLLDDNANPGLWRQSTDDRRAGESSPELGPMVTGTVLGFVSENGTLIGSASADPALKALTDQRAAIRPRFSRASMIGFFVSELLLHALAQLNASVPDGQQSHENDVRELRQVIVLSPPSLSSQERQALLSRVEQGIELAWRGLGWQAIAPGVPARPTVSLGAGGDVATQIAYLHNEVTAKYQGRFRDLLRVYRGGDFTGGAAEAVRVASVDFGARSTTLTIVDYAAADESVVAHEWRPSVQVQERLPIGTDVALQALIWTLLLPAIEAHLAAAGLNPARHFLDEITGRSTTSLLVEDPYFTRRLNRKILWPAAQGLFALLQAGAASSAYGNRSIALATLVELGSGRMRGIAEAFDKAALQAGARGFALDATKIDLNRGELARIVRMEMQDCVQQVSRIVANNTCDLLLLGGDGTLLQPVCEAVLSALPVAASRIIDLNTHTSQAASDAIGRAGFVPTPAMLPAIAAAFDRRHLLELSGLSGVALQRPSIAASNGDGGPPAQRAISAPLPRPDDAERSERALTSRAGAHPAKGA